MLRFVTFTLIVGALLTLLGCSSRAVPGTAAQPASGTATATTGGLAFTIKWPARGRMPSGTQSVVIDISELGTGTSVLTAPKILNAPADSGDLPTTAVDFPNLPAKSLSIVIRAYDTPGGGGTVLGVAGTVVTIIPGKYTTTTINLTGAIVSAQVPPVPVFLHGFIRLVVITKDKDGALVPVPTPVSWISTDQSMSSVTANSDGSATVVGKKIGNATVRAILPNGLTVDGTIPVWYKTFTVANGAVVTLRTGDTQLVPLTATDALGATIPLTPAAVEWSDTNPTANWVSRARNGFAGDATYAFAADGTVTAKGRGTAALIAYIPSTMQIAATGVQVIGFQAVAGGNGFSVALDDTGEVWTWGKGTEGELGVGTTTGANTPVPVPNLTNVKAIAAGSGHVLALRQDGTVWGWGDNTHLQTGQGYGTVPAPMQVAGLANVIGLAAGVEHSLAYTSAGVLYSWGGNAHGELCNYNSVDMNTPSALIGIYSESCLAAGDGDSFAVSDTPSAGSPWCWGTNTAGQLGKNATDLAQMVNMPTDFGQEGVFDGIARIVTHGHLAAAVDTNGTVAVWGQNPVTGSAMIQPFGLSMPAASDLAVGDSHLLTLTSGNVMAWGDNTYGQLGTGDTTARNLPVTTSLGATIVAVGAGGTHSLAIDTTGNVWTWGDNTYGQIGNGTITKQPTPTNIAFSTGKSRQGKGRIR